MKIKQFFLGLVLASAVLSCKNQTKNQTINEEVLSQSTSFKVIVNVVVKKNDDFCLLYTQDGTINFKDGVWKEVKGSDVEQTVEFYLPEDIYPTQLRLDLGRSKEQDDIIIKSVKFDYLGNVLELVGPQVGVFFTADASKCTYDFETGVVKRLVKDNIKQSPSLYPHELVQANELPKLMK